MDPTPALVPSAPTNDPLKNMDDVALWTMRDNFSLLTMNRAKGINKRWRAWIKSFKVPAEQCLDEMGTSEMTYKLVCNHEGYTMCEEKDRVLKNCENICPANLSICFACKDEGIEDKNHSFKLFGNFYFLCDNCTESLTPCEICGTPGIAPYNEVDGKKCPEGPFLLQEYQKREIISWYPALTAEIEPINTCNKLECRMKAKIKEEKSLEFFEEQRMESSQEGAQPLSQ